MSESFQFQASVLNSVIGGRSSLDLPRLHIHDVEDASAFLAGYGFQLDDEQTVKRLWYFHRRALVFLEEKLGFDSKEIPEILRDPKQLGDIRNLLYLASSEKSSESKLQKWSCALLRVMHVFVHTENDLFSTFSEDIQKQILTPFQTSIVHDGSDGQSKLKGTRRYPDPISLLKFEVKPFKTSTSAVIKLLAKPDALAMSVYDKLGVRFVTHTMFDAFRVVRFMVDENLISFPHIMPDQSSNTIYPVELFLEVCKNLIESKEQPSPSQLDEVFAQVLRQNSGRAEFLRKENTFSGADYRFIKFIARKLIRITGADGRGFSFFFPFEVQIMDQGSYSKILSGPAEHQAYKERQRLAAKKRVLPESSIPQPTES
jgi:uncharacterized protein (TIGR04562 family)